MAAAMLSKLVGVAVLVALIFAVAAVQAQAPVPAAGGAPTCDIVDQNVVNACFKSFQKGMKLATAPRGSDMVNLDCCVVFSGHSCLCKMKKVWQKNGKTAQNNVQCVREKVC